MKDSTESTNKTISANLKETVDTLDYNYYILVLQKISLMVMALSATILVVCLINPQFWDFCVVFMDGLDEDNIIGSVKETLNKTNDVLDNLKEITKNPTVNVNVDVSPTAELVANRATSALTVSGGIYLGTKMAEIVPTLAGKAAVVAASVVATATAKVIIEEAKLGNILIAKISDDKYDRPSSPTDPDWTNSAFEPNLLDPSKFLPHVESTDSLQRILESVLTLSWLNASLTVYLLVSIIMSLINFTKIKWLEDKPKLLKFIERNKTARTLMLIPALILILFTSLISVYGLSSILSALAVYKSML